MSFFLQFDLDHARIFDEAFIILLIMVLHNDEAPKKKKAHILGRWYFISSYFAGILGAVESGECGHNRIFKNKSDQ